MEIDNRGILHFLLHTFKVNIMWYILPLPPREHNLHGLISVTMVTGYAITRHIEIIIALGHHSVRSQTDEIKIGLGQIIIMQ